MNGRTVKTIRRYCVLTHRFKPDVRAKWLSLTGRKRHAFRREMKREIAQAQRDKGM